MTSRLLMTSIADDCYSLFIDFKQSTFIYSQWRLNVNYVIEQVSLFVLSICIRKDWIEITLVVNAHSFSFLDFSLKGQ